MLPLRTAEFRAALHREPFPRVAADLSGGRKRSFLAIIHINAMFLPRQALDKHREDSITRLFFSQGAVTVQVIADYASCLLLGAKYGVCVHQHIIHIPGIELDMHI